MDTGNGKFEMLQAATDELEAKKKALEEEYPNHGGWFTVGEIIVIRESRFRVKAVKPTEIRLKLLPRARQ
jgi:hypothetical protein